MDLILVISTQDDDHGPLAGDYFVESTVARLDADLKFTTIVRVIQNYPLS